MKIKFIILGMFALILLSSLASAATNVSRTNPNPYTLLTGSDTPTYGIVFIPVENFTILNATAKNTADMPEGCELRDGPYFDSTLLTTGTFSGNDCVFASKLLLSANQSYGVGWTGTFSAYYNNTGLINRTVGEVMFTSTSWRGDGDLTQAPRALVAIGLQTTDFPTTSLSLNYPTNSSSSILSPLNFSATLIPMSQNLTNATLYLYNSTGLFNISGYTFAQGTSTTQTINFTVNTMALDTYTWNVFGCAKTDSGTVTCLFAPSNYTLTWGYKVNSNSYNTSTYETARENFISNVSTGTSLSTAYLYYNGTLYTGTVNSEGNSNYIISKGIDVPAGIGTKNWFWNLIYSNGQASNTTSLTQIVSQINLTICGASPLNTPYINFTFKNETTSLQTINASLVSSSWTYWLSSASVNKTLSYSNASYLLNYGFCFMPSNRSVNVQMSTGYENAESTQRQFRLDNTVLTNVTTSQVLYLLPSYLGIYSRYKVVNNVGAVIGGVVATVTRLIGSTTTIVGTGLTDSSGQIAFFLNPDISYDYSFSKTGVGSTTFSLTPNSVDTYTITLGSTGQGISNGTTVVRGLNYTIYPTNDTLLNNTLYTFALNVSGQDTITFISLNITNSTGTQVAYTSTSGAGYISTNYNTGNATYLIGTAKIQTATETIITLKRWDIADTFVGDYSLYKQLTLFKQYGFNNWWMMVLAIGCITLITLLLNKGEVIDTSESKIAVIVLLVWAFSIVGWFDTGFTATIDTNAPKQIVALAAFSSQYGIAIVTTAIGLFFVLGRIVNR